jgi:hypothetical protein
VGVVNLELAEYLRELDDEKRVARADMIRRLEAMNFKSEDRRLAADILLHWPVARQYLPIEVPAGHPCDGDLGSIPL